MEKKEKNEETPKNQPKKDKSKIKKKDKPKKKEKKQKKEKTKKQKNKKTKKKKRNGKTTASVTFYYIIAVSVIALAIGSIWAGMDAIQPEGKWEWFLGLGVGLQFIIIGAFGIIFFILLISAWVMFRKGNKLIYNLLYPDIEKIKEPKENTWAKIITAGLLISVFIITSGLVASIIDSIFAGDGSQSFFEFLFTLPNGLKIMLISGLVLLITSLLVGFVWIWENGYNMVLNKILKTEPHKKPEYSKKQRIASTNVYVISFVAIIALAFGSVWSIADAIAPTGKWEAFVDYPLSWQITIIGALASLLFELLIFGLMFYRRGLDAIKKRLFKNIEFDGKIEPSQIDKFGTIGLLLFLLIILIGGIYTLLMYLIQLSEGGETTSLIDWLIALPNGLLILLCSGLLLGITWAIIGGQSAAKVTYYKLLKVIVKIRHRVSEDDEEYDREKEHPSVTSD